MKNMKLIISLAVIVSSTWSVTVMADDNPAAMAQIETTPPPSEGVLPLDVVKPLSLSEVNYTNEQEEAPPAPAAPAQPSTPQDSTRVAPVDMTPSAGPAKAPVPIAPVGPGR